MINKAANGNCMVSLLLKQELSRFSNMIAVKDQILAL